MLSSWTLLSMQHPPSSSSCASLNRQRRRILPWQHNSAQVNAQGLPLVIGSRCPRYLEPVYVRASCSVIKDISQMWYLRYCLSSGRSRQSRSACLASMAGCICLEDVYSATQAKDALSHAYFEDLDKAEVDLLESETIRAREG